MDATNANTNNKLAEADGTHDETIITNNNNLNTWDVNSLSTPMQSHWYTQRVNRSNSSTPTQPITNTAATSMNITFNADHNTNTNSNTDNSNNAYSSEDNMGVEPTSCSNENTNNTTSTTNNNNNNNNTSTLTKDDSHSKSLTVTLATPSEQSTTFDPINSSFIDLTGSALLNDYKQQQQRPRV